MKLSFSLKCFYCVIDICEFFIFSLFALFEFLQFANLDWHNFLRFRHCAFIRNLTFLVMT